MGKQVGFITGCREGDDTPSGTMVSLCEVLEHIQEVGSGWVIWRRVYGGGAHSTLGVVRKWGQFYDRACR